MTKLSFFFATNVVPEEKIKRILTQIGQRGAFPIEPLPGGITNQNYRVGNVVIRIYDPGSKRLGIDREHERVCATTAAGLGIAPQVIAFLPSEHALVTQYISGTTLTPETIRQPDIFPRVVKSIQCCHTGPLFPGRFSPFETVRNYHRLATKHRVSFPDNIGEVLLLLAEIEDTLHSVEETRPCHNDLLSGNFLDDGEKIWILDWEYAGMGDPFFDLGNFSANQELDESQCQTLLSLYFGNLRSIDMAHLYFMRLASDLREAFWGFLQIGISSLDFDYREYAQKHLDRFLRNAATPQLTRWLAEVKSG